LSFQARYTFWRRLLIPSSSLVIDDATKRFEAGQSPRPVYFYCSRSAAEIERTNPDTVIASILRQLSCAQIDNPLPSSLVDKYKKQGQGFESHGLPLEESLQLIIAMIGDYGMTTIVVDALDECDPNTRQSLLDAFEDILRESAGLVKIFVSSRDDQDIVYTLRGYPNMDISSNKNAADIKVYVEKETQRLVQRGRLLRNSMAKVDMQALIIDQVIEGADGMLVFQRNSSLFPLCIKNTYRFRWASLQLEVLCTLKLDEDIRGRLGKLPPKLEQLYLEVYNELSSHEGDAGRTIIDSTLKWLLCSQRMLHTSEFLMAVAVNLDIAFEGITIDHILDLCHNFVLYDEELDVFRFAHLSVREFLEKRPAFDQIPCNLLAAESCLLQIIGSSNGTDLILDQSIERVTRLRVRLAPSSESASKNFLAYANVEWMNHCKLIPQSVRTNHNSLARLLQSFFNEDLGHGSAFYVWVGWYCSRVWGEDDSEVSWQLQILLSNYSRPPARSFFVAIAYGFGEHVALCVLDRALGNEEKGKGLLLAVMANQHKIVDLLVEDEGDWKVTEPILFFAVQNLENERFAWLLDKATNFRLTARTVTAAGKSRNGKSMALLLQRYPGLVITEEMLKTSVISANHEAFRLLLARALDQVLTESLFRIAIYKDQPVKLVSLLNRIGPCRLSPYLFRQAGIFSDGSLEVMLERGGAACITTEFMIGVASSDNLKALQLMVDYGGAISQELLVAVAGEVAPDVLRLLLEHGCVVNGDILKSQAKGRKEDYKSLEIMLNYVDDGVIAEELTSLMVAVAGSSTRGAIMRVLHDRAQDTKVSEDVLLAAACNFSGGSKMMEMFLEQDKTLTITAEVLICAMATHDLDVIVPLLERVEEVKSIMNELLEAAAQNLLSGERLMRLLLQLKSADITRIPDVVYDKAIGNSVSGEYVIRALEESFGPIEVTEDVMLKLVRNGSGCGQLPSGANYLFDPARITGTVFLAAMSIDPPRWIWDYGGTRLDIRHVVVENALHLPVTPEILKSAARYSDVACFRTLWIRGGMATDTPELMQRAAKNSRNGHPIFQFLLDQVEIVEIDETLMLAIVGNPDTSTMLLHLLWERDITLSVTHDVLQKAIANTDFQDIDCWGLTFLLEHFSHVEVTDDLFKTTATAGNEDLLCKLSQLCNMESPPGKWLDVARLYKAVALGDNDSLNNLLERGVELEARELECTFPVKQAFERDQVSTIQILLAAGMAPDALIDGRTLLFSAAAWGKHRLVEVLAKAGASLDFKGAMYGNRFDDGYTPCAIAKKRGFYHVFKLLEQFGKDRDREREAAAVIST